MELVSPLTTTPTFGTNLINPLAPEFSLKF